MSLLEIGSPISTWWKALDNFLTRCVTCLVFRKCCWAVIEGCTWWGGEGRERRVLALFIYQKNNQSGIAEIKIISFRVTLNYMWSTAFYPFLSQRKKWQNSVWQNSKVAKRKRKTAYSILILFWWCFHLQEVSKLKITGKKVTKSEIPQNMA